MWLSRKEANRAREASLEGDTAWHERHLALYKADSAAFKEVPMGENHEEGQDV